MRQLILSYAMTVAVLACIGCGQGEEQAPGAVDHLVVPERAGHLLQATQHYGPLTVQEGEYYAEADTKPWSSYWYPRADPILVKPTDANGGQAILDKFDKYVSKVFGRPSTAAKMEIDLRLYDPDAAGWEGRCNAWAYASVFEPEPKLAEAGAPVQGITFYTRDVKALMIKSYELVESGSATQLLKRFGQRYDGQGEDFEDLYPDQFHRILQAELYEKSRPIIMDHEAGVQVWNAPIWKANIVVEKDAEDGRIFHVTTTVLGVNSLMVQPNYTGTWSTRFEYTYDLIGYPQSDRSLLVKYGRWTGRSKKDHPDFVVALPPKGTSIRHESINKQVTQEIISDILDKTGASRP